MSSSNSVEIFRFNIQYSRIVLALEVLFFVIIFLSLLMLREQLWFMPSLILCILVGYIYFQSFSLTTGFPKDLVFEFRTAPERLICYDSNGESSYLLQQLDVRMTRWFILLNCRNASNQLNRALFQDNFVDMNHYTRFRRKLILSSQSVNKQEMN